MQVRSRLWQLRCSHARQRPGGLSIRSNGSLATVPAHLRKRKERYTESLRFSKWDPKATYEPAIGYTRLMAEVVQIWDSRVQSLERQLQSEHRQNEIIQEELRRARHHLYVSRLRHEAERVTDNLLFYYNLISSGQYPRSSKPRPKPPRQLLNEITVVRLSLKEITAKFRKILPRCTDGSAGIYMAYDALRRNINSLFSNVETDVNSISQLQRYLISSTWEGKHLRREFATFLSETRSSSEPSRTLWQKFGKVQSCLADLKHQGKKLAYSIFNEHLEANDLRQRVFRLRLTRADRVYHAFRSISELQGVMAIISLNEGTSVGAASAEEVIKSMQQRFSLLAKFEVFLCDYGYILDRQVRTMSQGDLQRASTYDHNHDYDFEFEDRQKVHRKNQPRLYNLWFSRLQGHSARGTRSRSV